MYIFAYLQCMYIYTLCMHDYVSKYLLLQVVEITEAVFSGVPKKHHLNCGFSVVSYHPTTQEEQTFNLLAESTDIMRYWVYGLRYVLCGVACVLTLST